MAVGLGWSLDVGLGLRARLHRGAVFVIVHIAVVALLGLAADAKLVADLVDLIGFYFIQKQQVKALCSNTHFISLHLINQMKRNKRLIEPFNKQDYTRLVKNIDCK